jgi:hypothetical protein
MNRLIPLVLVTVAVAGCGDSAPSLGAFKSGFKSDKTSFRRLGLDLQRAIATAQTKTDTQVATEIAALGRRAEQEAGALSKLNPPGRFQSDLHRLELGFRALGVDLNQISAAATKHNANAARAGTAALLRDAARIKASDKAISSGLHIPAG